MGYRVGHKEGLHFRVINLRTKETRVPESLDPEKEALLLAQVGHLKEEGTKVKKALEEE